MTTASKLQTRNHVPRQVATSEDDRLSVLRSRLRLLSSTAAYIIKLKEELAELKHFKEWVIEKFKENDVNRHRLEKEVCNLSSFHNWA